MIIFDFKIHFHKKKKTHFLHLEQSLGTLVWIFHHPWWCHQNHRCIAPKMLPFSSQYYFCQNRKRRIYMLNLRFRNNQLEYEWSIRVIKYLSISQYDQPRTIFRFFRGSKCANLMSPVKSGRPNKKDHPILLLWTVHFWAYGQTRVNSKWWMVLSQTERSFASKWTVI